MKKSLNDNDLGPARLLTKNILPSLDGEIVGGKGAEIFLKDGQRVLDFSSQTVNLSLGHGHPGLIRAAKKQLDAFYYHSSRFSSGVFLELAAKLLALNDKSLNRINLKLTNGSDAVESTIKRARAFSGKRVIVAFKKSHHGETVETLASDIKTINGPYLGSRRDYLWLDPDDRCLGQFERILKKRTDIAGLILEPIMVNAGVIVHPASRLRRLKQLCRKYQVALIFDEVQTAFGWLETTFAYQKLKVVPDMLALGKALAPGFPLAAAVMNEKFDCLDYGYDELTYGGHPVSCAVALKNLEILQTNRKVFSARRSYLSRKLSCLGARGDGLIWGFECQSPQKAKKIYQSCWQQDLLLRLSGDGKTLIFKPPLVVTKKQIDRAVKIFETLWS